MRNQGGDFYQNLTLQTLATLIGVCLTSLFFATPVSAETITASSISQLQSFINGAHDDDEIVLADGIYSNSTLTIGTSNITVRAETPGGVYLNGTNAITISGNYVTFSGFQFTSGSISGVVIDVRGSGNLLTQLNFKGYSAQKYIVLQDGSQYNEISFSNFENKPASAPAGNLIHVAAHASIPGYHLIRYSSFQNMPGAGGDFGNEPIRLSNGAQSTYISRTVVEFNYFTNTGPGDSEAISVKCRQNTLRHNTFTKNQDAMMVFRNGNDNIAYGNYFIDAGGIRVKEANNIYAYNNYFERSGVGGTMNAVTYEYVSGNLQNINFIHNTFVDSGVIDLASGATANTWSNNIFDKGLGNIFTGSIAGISWAGNIYYGALGVSIASGMTSANPQLQLNSDGYYGLSLGSPAIDAASASYPVILDIPTIDDDPSVLRDGSGQGRPVTRTSKDVGSDEFATGGTINTDPVINRPLELSDVGPSYLGGPGSGTIASPGPPSGLNVLGTTSTQVSLSWLAPSTGGAPSSYNVLRCLGSFCSPTPTGSTSAGTAFTDTELSAGTTYRYAVTATNAGGTSSASSAVTATTQNVAAPAVPKLSVGSPTKNSLTLTWTLDTSSISVTGFDILRCTGFSCGNPTLITSVGSAARSYKNSGLSRLTTYTYQVRAKNSGGTTLSNSASGSTTK